MFEPFTAQDKARYAMFFSTGWDVAGVTGARPADEDLVWLAWTTCINFEQRLWLAHGMLAGYHARMASESGTR